MQTVRLIFVISMSLIILGCAGKKNLAGNKGEYDTELQRKLEKLTIKGSTEKLIGNYEEARLTFEECLALEPENANAYFELSGIYFYANNINQAIAMAIKSAEINPSNEWYKTNLAVLYNESGNFAAASRVYEELVKSYPTRYEYLFTLAETYLQQNKAEEALRVYEKMEQKLGITNDLLIHKHQLYLQIGQTDKARIQIETLVKNNPTEISFRGILAEFYEHTGEDQKALALYEQLALEDPDNGQVHLSLHNFHRYHGNREKAYESLLTAFSKNNLDIDIKMQILLGYYTNSERNPEIKKEAYELIDIFIKTHPDNPKSYTIYGDFLTRDTRNEEALDAFRKALKLDATKFPIWSQTVYLESDLKAYNYLAEDSKTAMDLFPNSPLFYYFNGIANLKLNQPEKAIFALKIGKEYVLDNYALLAEFYLYLGDAYHLQKEHQLSDEAYTKSLKLNSNNAYVLNNYSYHLSERRIRLSEAEDMAFKANEIMPNTPSFLDTYGWILFLREKFLDAEVWIHKALQNGGDSDGTILEHYGDVLFHLGKEPEALDYWIRAKESGEASDLIIRKISEKNYVE